MVDDICTGYLLMGVASLVAFLSRYFLHPLPPSGKYTGIQVSQIDVILRNTLELAIIYI